MCESGIVCDVRLACLRTQLMSEDGGNKRRMESQRDVHQDDDRRATGFHSYMSAKKAKLKDQFDDDARELSHGDIESQSRLFAGMRIHTNGCAHPSNEELRHMIAKHGGEHHFYLSKKETTHIVTETLAFSKMKTLAGFKVVRPAWIVDSIAQKRLLPVHQYSILEAKHQLYQKGNASVVEEEDSQAADESDASAEETSDDTFEPVAGSNDSSALKAGDPGFLEAYFAKSRLHHLTTAGNEFKQYIEEKRNGKAPEFVGLQRLKRFVKEMQLTSPVTWPGPMIMHIDMDCFFVSVGLLDKPLLRDKPVAVAHAKTSRGEDRADHSGDQWNSFSELASCNYEARRFGVRNGMFLHQALKLCPGLKLIAYNFQDYDRVSRVLYDLLSSYTLDIEAVSCDEMFVDVKSIAEEAKCEPKQLASFVRQEMCRLTQCNSSVGIGPNVLIAKLASKAAKPDNHVIVHPDDVVSFMRNKKISDLPGVGSSLASKMAEKFSAESCLDMQHVTVERLREVLGKGLGEKVHSLVRGEDRHQLKFDQASARKSVSVEINYGIRLTKWSALEGFVHEMAQETSKRMQKAKVKGKCIALKVKVRREDAPVQNSKYMGHGICDNFSRSTLLSFPTDSHVLIGKSAVNILQSMNVNVPDLRGIAIQVSKLTVLKTSDSSVCENPNSISRFFLSADPDQASSSSSSPSTSSSAVPQDQRLCPKPRNQCASAMSISDIDRSVLHELPEDVRNEVMSSFRMQDPVDQGSDQKVGIKQKNSSVRTKRSPKKKALPVQQSKAVAGPLDRIFSNMNSGGVERKVTSIMNRPSALCGLNGTEEICDVLTEWVTEGDVLYDEDVAYVTRFLFDLIGNNKWTTLKTVVSALHQQIRDKGDDQWLELYETVAAMVRQETRGTVFERDICQQLKLL